MSPINNGAIFFKLSSLKLNTLIQWTKRKPKYQNTKISKEDFDLFYEIYQKNQQNVLTLENNSIYMLTDWGPYLWLTDLIQNEINKQKSVIKVSHPLLFELNLDASIYSMTAEYVWTTENTDPQKNFHDKYFKINKELPLFIILKIHVKKMDYIPLGLDRGFTIDIHKIKILKYKKRFFHHGYFIYTMDCESQGPSMPD